MRPDPILRKFRCLLVAARCRTRDAESPRLNNDSLAWSRSVRQNGADFRESLRPIGAPCRCYQSLDMRPREAVCHVEPGLLDELTKIPMRTQKSISLHSAAVQPSVKAEARHSGMPAPRTMALVLAMRGSGCFFGMANLVTEEILGPRRDRFLAREFGRRDACNES
ncbi:hypothetical protein P171DRAFT_221901 [Karstenula rhodostoma CBS 690.94]|uniref:Uncharacterized protein n=1 Tax=Karstenula rhodostoma CBS 690.94 TaxID=1392251 RepID=A0A9P4PU17_9PLEO|nr:hypothetical protein P171DRAFT_221901 [Karstenula rhodostoma CBS 690.94]